MIVRISTEGQYRLSADLVDRLNQLDNRIVDVVSTGDEPAFKELYSEMIGLVRKEGTLLGDEEIEKSEIVLPPPDLTLEEAKGLFTRDGLVPG